MVPMSDSLLSITPEIHKYLLSVSLREHPVLTALRTQTQTMPAGVMQISPEQGQFMQLLVKLLGAKKTLEVGVFTGYSALSVALALPEDGKIIACDVNEEWTSIAQTFWEKAGVSHKIHLKLAPALETMQRLIEQGEAASFDFIFLDADKANYPQYYELAIQLIRVGGLIAVDNVLWGGDVANPTNHDKQTEAIRSLNQKVFNDDRVDISLVPIRDGLTLARKKDV